ncbi:MAG: TonB-dependent receptor [Flavobacteriaceae bacterium]|nr:TonB-dependent receptor [Flavobacteriaceae bacterium]
MKLSAILIIVALLNPVFASTAKAQKLDQISIDLTVNKASIEEIIADIESQTPFSFVYGEKVTEIKKRYTLDYHNISLKSILELLAKDAGLSFKRMDENISIDLKTKKIKEEVVEVVFREITGIVIDETGAPLPGASVIERGAVNGTATDFDGKFTLDVGPDAILEVSYIGYHTKEVLVGEQTSLTIQLEPASSVLDEIVVVGYGTQKKMNLTGSVSQLEGEDLQDRPVTNMTQALQGVIPNLNIVIGSGKPGTSGTLNIRGNTSITGSGEPLVLIDGVPGEIDRVNVRDVESITVLKDASASAIYGARAAFGVILVTTKNGGDGKPVISYNNNTGWITHATNTDFVTSAYDNIRINEESYYNALGRNWTGYTEEDYAEIYARRNDRTEHPDRPWVMIKPDRNGNDVYKYYANFDWFNWFYSKWRPKIEHNLSITGSSEKVRYYLSGGVRDETGIMKQNPDSFKRYNFNGKIEAELFPWLTVKTNLRFFNSNYRYYGKEGGMFPTTYNNLSTNQLYMITPANVPTNPDGTGTYLMDNGTYAIGYGAHLSQMNPNLVGNNAVNDYTLNFEGVVKLSEALSVTGNFTYNLENGQDMYRGVRLQYSLYPGVVEQVPRAEWDRDILKETTRNNKYNIFNVYGTYDKTFGEHNVKLTAGYNQEERKFKRVYAEGQELLSETLNDLNLATGERQVSGGASEWALSGLFYRANYNYKGKYLFEASGRYDGTSRFRKGDRFGFFPSFSAGWRISEEKFFEPARNIVDNLKIRASYGSLGNQQVDTYAYIPSMPSSNMSYIINGQRLSSVSSPDPISPNLTWERTTSHNLGIDVEMLRNRMSIVFDTYIRDTEGMLVKGKTLPSVFGASEPQENAADMRTKGFEISLNWKDNFELFKKPFTYTFGLILSDYTSKITKFDNPSRILSDYYEGQELGEIWGFVYDGFFGTTEEAQAYPVNQDLINRRRVQAPTAELRMLQAGDIKIVDLDNDGEISFGAGTVDDPGDRRKIGNSQPRYSFAVPMGFSWNGFDINALFQGIGRQHYYPDLENQRFWNAYARPYGSFLPTDFESKIWRPDNTNAYFPRMIGYIAQNSELRYENNMYLQDLAYVKLRNLTIGYTIPESVTEKINLQRVRMYLSGENLFTWTKLDSDYIDPEEVMWDRTSRTYPIGRTYSLGVEIRF